MEQRENMPVLTETQKLSTSFLLANNLEDAQRAAMMISSSDLVPEMYKVGGRMSGGAQQTREKAVANCLLALDMSQRMNANPLMIMQNLYIVQGKPGWSSSFLISTVNTCGRYKPLRFKMGQDGEVEIAGKMIPNRTCAAYTSEKGNEDCILEGATISMAMAKAESWTSKNGSKWLTMPEQMLMYRAASFWVRIYAPELSNGMKTAEEWQDAVVVDEDTSAETDAQQQQPIGHRAPAAAAVAESNPNARFYKEETPEQNDGEKEKSKTAGQHPEHQEHLEHPEWTSTSQKRVPGF